MKKLLIILFCSNFHPLFAMEVSQKPLESKKLKVVEDKRIEKGKESDAVAVKDEFGKLAPKYCKKDHKFKTCNSQEINDQESVLEDILKLSTDFKHFEFENNIAKVAIAKLLDQKRDLIAPFDELDLRLPLKDRHMGNEYNCSKEIFGISSRIRHIDNQFDNYRKKFTNDKTRNLILSNKLMGLIAAEKGVEKRPQLKSLIEAYDESLKKLGDKIKNINRGEVRYLPTGALSTSPCNTIAKLSYNKDKCIIYKKEQTNLLKTTMDNVEKLKEKSETELKLINDLIFKDPMYIRENDHYDKMGNFAKNMLKTTKYETQMGDFRKTPLMKNSLKKLRRTEGGKDLMREVASLIKSFGDDKMGADIAQVKITDFLKKNPTFKEKFQSLYQDEVKYKVTKNDELIEKICETKGQGLIQDAEFVKKVENDFLQTTLKKFGPKTQLAPYLKSFQQAHCVALEKARKNDISGELTGFQIGGALLSMGFGIAGSTVCGPPCLWLSGVAVAATGAVTIKEYNHFEFKDHSLDALVMLGSKRQEEAREAMLETQEAWAFLMVDLATAPFGFKVGQAYRARKAINKGRKTLGKSELGKNKVFHKALFDGLPEDEYLKLTDKISSLGEADQIILAEKIKKLNLDFTDKHLRLARIQNVLAEHKIEIPDEKVLNRVNLARIRGDEKIMQKLEKDYGEEMLRLEITPGTPEAKDFLSVAGILENKGCAGGICITPMVSKKKVVEQYEEMFKQCRI